MNVIMIPYMYAACVSPVLATHDRILSNHCPSFPHRRPLLNIIWCELCNNRHCYKIIYNYLCLEFWLNNPCEVMCRISPCQREVNKHNLDLIAFNNAQGQLHGNGPWTSSELSAWIIQYSVVRAAQVYTCRRILWEAKGYSCWNVHIHSELRPLWCEVPLARDKTTTCCLHVESVLSAEQSSLL
jgi:hypothetical protein